MHSINCARSEERLKVNTNREIMNILNLQQRSIMSFGVIAFFAVGFTVFIIQKASDATNEIKLLNSNHATARRALIEKELDEREGLGASSTPQSIH